ncbi:MAG: energy transducer TonB [Gammaproteobacteria bacterium]|nr:energy transducer TonB [Gammaproteobacteria bacterium]
MNYKIPIFIFISTAAHFLVLGAYSNRSISFDHATQAGYSTLEVEISAQKSRNKNIDVIQKTISSATDKTSKPLDELDTEQQHQKVAQTTPIKKQTVAVNTQQAISTGNKKEPDILLVTHILKNGFSRHFYYPKTAQRRSWQGKVLLEFTITSSGNIEKIHINSSSGYSVLDNAAIDALKKIEENNEFALALNGHSIEQILPVTYKLID